MVVQQKAPQKKYILWGAFSLATKLNLSDVQKEYSKGKLEPCEYPRISPSFLPHLPYLIGN
ncbi:hypothetical protein COY33_00150 [candidate division WWE3 bacterium CG_4_10_14_0_2_um_filter_42_7]|uniref:Uncharacterized protein n=1 Tax=candidate division WWE3 bacterium CG_4_10_14_0_2_um_filter_42_7 TaxID=1975073 RepID=A0A2M7TEN8_UNCKA|nr:MAG: hypothetical protein COY33_00150 [candidate division WWE3 bacterium CG_4_10_14_0_2_um_filter_42_7]